MSGSRLRLILSAVLFFSWLGYLAFLAFNYANPIVVSRSQMLLTDEVARVQIRFQGDLPPEVKIIELLGTSSDSDRKDPMVEIEIRDFGSALLPKQKPLIQDGQYLVPIQKMGDNRYRLTIPPQSPEQDGIANRPIVYPDTPSVEEQIRHYLSLLARPKQ